MFAASGRIMAAGEDWTPQRRQAAEDYWAAYERLQREVYGIGPLRHCLAPPYLDLPWYKSWSQHQKLLATRPSRCGTHNKVVGLERGEERRGEPTPPKRPLRLRSRTGRKGDGERGRRGGVRLGFRGAGGILRRHGKEPSSLAAKLGGKSGILELMDDLDGPRPRAGHAHAGRGNPAAIPEVCAVWRERCRELLDDAARFDAMLNSYDSPQAGRPDRCGRGVLQPHVRMEAHERERSHHERKPDGHVLPAQHVRRPISGWQQEKDPPADRAGVHRVRGPGAGAGLLRAVRPSIEFLDKRTFKYHIDFSALKVAQDIGADRHLRPTNPTGNAIGDAELARLSALAKESGRPLLIDNAYGLPFPHILFKDINLLWDEHIILSFSLSKLGLPGARTGIVIAARP